MRGTGGDSNWLFVVQREAVRGDILGIVLLVVEILTTLREVSSIINCSSHDFNRTKLWKSRTIG